LPKSVDLVNTIVCSVFFQCGTFGTFFAPSGCCLDFVKSDDLLCRLFSKVFDDFHTCFARLGSRGVVYYGYIVWMTTIICLDHLFYLSTL
jgi:hypothetical protein